MSKQRRRAANFTDSLYSFRLAISQESLEDANSNDTKENETWKEKNNIASQNSGCSELHSVILAGNTVLASNNYESLAPISPLSSTKDQSLPDLNKCIDLFHNERNDEQQYSDKREIPYGKFDNCESKKDEENIGPAASELFPLSKLSMNKEEYNQNQGQFETILCSLDNRVNQLKEATLSEQTLRRLSKHFLKCPRNFTEKLIRVTEESVLNASNDIHDRSSLNLSRLTAEFKKMCKYINDESSPEWCTSLTISPAIEKTANDTNLMDAKSSEKRMNKSVPSPSIRCSLATPRLYALRKGRDIRKYRTSRDIFKCTSEDNLQNAFSEHSTDSFERLEAECESEKLYSERAQNHTPLRTSLSMPSLISMSVIRNICEEQMASLNTNSAKKVTATDINSQSPIFSNKCVRAKSIDNVKSTTHCTNTYLESEDLSKCGLNTNILLEIVEKRRECFNMLNTINESNESSRKTETELAPSKSANGLSGDDNAFINTLVSCQEYHNYLTHKKPLLDFLQERNKSIIESISQERKCTQDVYKKTNKENIGLKSTLSVKRARKSYLKMDSKSPNTQCKSSIKERKKEGNDIYQGTKPKLFVTPGKSPVNKNSKKKCKYFPSMDNDLKILTSQNIMRSPHAKGLYRLNYNTVMSPVHMYITGTDTQLIKNVRAKTDEMLLTPVKIASKTPNTKSPCSVSSRSISKSQEKPPLKVKLSPKLFSTPKSHTSKVLQSNEITSNRENTPNNCFLLPKVYYTSPCQVRKIKDNTPENVGSRIKSLIGPTQSKVVIQHRGKANSARIQKGIKDDNSINEIYYNPEDESLHIEQTATRTNFMSKR